VIHREANRQFAVEIPVVEPRHQWQLRHKREREASLSHQPIGLDSKTDIFGQFLVIRAAEEPSIEFVSGQVNLRGAAFGQLVLSLLELFLHRLAAAFSDRRERPRTGRRHLIRSLVSGHRSPSDCSDNDNKDTRQ
jgi:hypothetical protein